MKVTTENLTRRRVEDVDIGSDELYTIELTASHGGDPDIEFRLYHRVWEEDGDAESGPSLTCHWEPIEEIDTPNVPLIWEAFTFPSTKAAELVEELVRHGRAYWTHCQEMKAR